MATETFYERRMKALQDERVSHNVRTVNPLIQRPTNSQPNGMANNPNIPDQSENIDSSTPFFMHVDKFKQDDPEFGSMMENYTQLALGLKSSVDQGIMPEPVAKQKLQDFLNDQRDAKRNQLAQQSEKDKATSQMGSLGQALMQLQQGGTQNG